MINQQSEKRTVAQLSAETILAMKYMRQVDVGTLVTWDMGRTNSGFDWTKNPGLVRTAIQRLWKDECIYFVNVRGEGYKRVDESEAVDYGKREINCIFKKSKRTGHKMAVINSDKLPREKKASHFAAMAQLGVLMHASKQKTCLALEGGINGKPMELESALQKLMEAQKK